MTAENCHTQNLRLFFTPYLLYIKFLPWNIHLLGRKKMKRNKFITLFTHDGCFNKSPYFPRQIPAISMQTNTNK